MVHWERNVRSLLRPSEHLLLTLEGSYLRHHGRESDSDASLESSEESHVILAIVVHVNQVTEESGRSIINTFALSSCADHPPKCVPLHRGQDTF